MDAKRSALGREDMKKSVTWILAAMTAASLLPGMGVSHADTQCASEAQKYGYPGGVSDPRNGLEPGTRVLRMRTGPAMLPTYPGVPVSGLFDLGAYGCENILEQGLVNTNYILPGATVLQVIAINRPNDLDHLPTGGCLKWNGTPPAYPSACTGSNTVALRWHWQNGNPNENVPSSYSQVITIPAGITSATATAYLAVDTSHDSQSTKLTNQNMTVKYTTIA